MAKSGFYTDEFDEFNDEEKDYNGLVDESESLDSYNYGNDEEHDYFEEGESYEAHAEEYSSSFKPSKMRNNPDANDIGEQYDSETIGKEYSIKEWVELVEKYNHGTPDEKNEACELIYCAMIPFIKYLAKTLYSSYMPRYTEDLESAGKIGLFNILADYDPTKAKPTTWFSRSIIHEMRDFIDQEVHHTTPHYQNHLREIKKYINECKTKGVSYTIDDIMIATGYPKQTIINCTLLYERNQNQVSMEQFVGESKLAIMDTLVSPSPNPEDVVLENEQKEMIQRIMNTYLTETERNVTKRRHGFDDNLTMSSSDIAEELGLKKQDVRPIINMAERKLRNAIKRENRDMVNAKKPKKNGKSMIYLKAAGNVQPEYEFESMDF